MIRTTSETTIYGVLKYSEDDPAFYEFRQTACIEEAIVQAECDRAFECRYNGPNSGIIYEAIAFMVPTIEEMINFRKQAVEDGLIEEEEVMQYRWTPSHGPIHMKWDSYMRKITAGMIGDKLRGAENFTVEVKGDKAEAGDMVAHYNISMNNLGMITTSRSSYYNHSFVVSYNERKQDISQINYGNIDFKRGCEEAAREFNHTLRMKYHLTDQVVLDPTKYPENEYSVVPACIIKRR